MPCLGHWSIHVKHFKRLKRRKVGPYFNERWPVCHPFFRWSEKLYNKRLVDSSLQVRRKTAFLISSLLLPSNLLLSPSTTQNDYIHTAPFPNDPLPDPEAEDTVPLTKAALTDSSATDSNKTKKTLLETIVSELCFPTPHGPDGDGEPLHDPDLREKLAKCLVNYVRVGGKLDDESKEQIRECVGSMIGDDKLGLDHDELNLLLR